jgi:cytoskeletal protein CcmA (bactofilin family)
MFGSNKPKPEPGKGAAPSTGTHSLNSLVQGTVVEGKIKATNDIRIDGSIKGDLVCDAKVIIGPTGVVEGTIRCKNAVVEGRFEGIFSVAELLHIRETAKVTGEVSYGKLVVQSGAVISGSYKVAGENSNGAHKSADAAKVIANSKPSDAQNIAGKAHELSKEKVN